MATVSDDGRAQIRQVIEQIRKWVKSSVAPVNGNEIWKNGGSLETELTVNLTRDSSRDLLNHIAITPDLSGVQIERFPTRLPDVCRLRVVLAEHGHKQYAEAQLADIDHSGVTEVLRHSLHESEHPALLPVESSQQPADPSWQATGLPSEPSQALKQIVKALGLSAAKREETSRPKELLRAPIRKHVLVPQPLIPEKPLVSKRQRTSMETVCVRSLGMRGNSSFGTERAPEPAPEGREEIHLHRAMQASIEDEAHQQDLREAVRASCAAWWEANGGLVLPTATPEELATHNSLITAEGEAARKEFAKEFLLAASTMDESILQSFRDGVYLIEKVREFRREQDEVEAFEAAPGHPRAS
eukprot:TRINITY_DN28764_c0_g1_i1.p1 TRINITY_DN28764_c0_g1~~TRINITY_DN28764_c0_g1_i1.p1  ORF type:complete len:357 (+),score=55.19 TRINITY_DN28764_c0_g1_i1:74-1144(+)